MSRPCVSGTVARDRDIHPVGGVLETLALADPKATGADDEVDGLDAVRDLRPAEADLAGLLDGEESRTAPSRSRTGALMKMGCGVSLRKRMSWTMRPACVETVASSPSG